MSNALNKNQSVLLQGFVLFLFFGFLYLSFLYFQNCRFNEDELEHIHSSWYVFKGDIPYIDFFQHHHPLLYYLLAPLIPVFGETTATLFFFRSVNYGFVLIIYAITYLIGMEIYDRKTSFVAVLLLASAEIFVKPAIQIRPDVPMTVFGLLSVLFLVKTPSEKHRNLYLVLSALSWSIAFLFLQKIIFLGAIIGFFLIFELVQKRLRIYQVALFVGAVLISLLPYYAYLAISGHLSEYFTLNWLLNMNVIKHFSPKKYLFASFKMNTVLWQAFAASTVLAFRANGLRSERFLAIIALWLLGTLYTTRTPFVQYFLPIIPLVVILAAKTIIRLIDYNYVLGVLAILIAIVPYGYKLNKVAQRTNRKQLAKMEFVLNNTKPNDYVFDGDNRFNLFRKDVDFFWYSVREGKLLDSYRKIVDYEYDIKESIKEYNPKIISSTGMAKSREYFEHRCYERTEKYQDMRIKTRDKCKK